MHAWSTFYFFLSYLLFYRLFPFQNNTWTDVNNRCVLNQKWEIVNTGFESPGKNDLQFYFPEKWVWNLRTPTGKCSWCFSYLTNFPKGYSTKNFDKMSQTVCLESLLQTGTPIFSIIFTSFHLKSCLMVSSKPAWMIVDDPIKMKLIWY